MRKKVVFSMVLFLVLCLGIGIKDNVFAATASSSDPYLSYWGRDSMLDKNYPVNLTNAQSAWNKGITGKGVKVAILDSGIDASHQEFAGKNIIGVRCINVPTDGECDPSGSYNDDNPEGHGTSIAGIIAGNHDGAGIDGISPDVDLYIAKVTDNSGNFLVTDLIAAIQWAIKEKVDIIQLSSNILNDNPKTIAQIDQTFNNCQNLQQVIQDANNRGILFVDSSGNSGTDNPNDENVGYPARLSSVIAVGGVGGNKNDSSLTARAAYVQESQNDGQLQTVNGLLSPGWASTGKEVSIAAPSKEVLAPIPYTLYGEEESKEAENNFKNDHLDDDETGYAYQDGTSFAAPIVTGVLALMKQEFPTYSNDQIKRLLYENAEDIGDSGKDNEFGYGLAQATPITISNPYFNMWMKEKDRKTSFEYNDSLTMDATDTEKAEYQNPYQQYNMSIPSYWFVDHAQPDKYVRFFFHDFKADLTFKPETDANKRTDIINQSISNLSLTDLTPAIYTSGLNNDMQVTEYHTSLPSSTTMNQQIYYFVNAPNGVYTFSVLTNNTNLSAPNGLSTIHDEMQNVLDNFTINTSVAPNEITNDQLSTLAQTRVDGDIVPSDQYIFGADLGTTTNNDPMVSLSNLESKINTHLGSMTYDVQLDPYSDGVSNNDKIVEKIAQAGKIPVINMQMGDGGQTFRLQKILGDSTVNYNNLLIAWADYLKQTNTTVLLNLGSGFNGSYASANASTIDGPEPDIYKLAYRHVVDLFRQEGATNVKFVWTPNYVSQPDDFWNQIEKYYPGDDYVDWIGLMGEYFPGSGNFQLDVSNTFVNMQQKTQSFDDMFQTFYQNLRCMYPDKPMMMELKSTVSSDDPKEKANFVQQMFTNIPSEYKNIQMVTWDENGDTIYPSTDTHSQMEDDSSLSTFTSNLSSTSIDRLPTVSMTDGTEYTNQITTFENTNLYTKPDTNYATDIVVSPQTMNAIRQSGNWYLVKTNAGDTGWINTTRLIPSAPINYPQPTQITVNVPFYLYNNPFSIDQMQSLITPQTVTAYSEIIDANENTWYLIDSFAGKKWITAPSQTILKGNFSLTLTANTMMYNTQSTSSPMFALGSQTVTVLSRVNGWFQINTSWGPKWIQPAQGQYWIGTPQDLPSGTTYQTQGTLKMYTQPIASTAYDRNFDIGPQVVTETQKWVNPEAATLTTWFKIKSSVGDSWIKP